MNRRTRRKIKGLEAMVRVTRGLRRRGKKIVQCHGVFDLLHLGHIRHFSAAKEEGDVLIVTVTGDRHVRRGPDQPVFHENLRAEAVAALAITDYVCIVQSPTAAGAILALEPHVYARGAEYKEADTYTEGRMLDEREAVAAVGARLVFTDDMTLSSSRLMHSLVDVHSPRATRYLQSLARRVTPEQLAEQLASLRKLKALVIGDTIVDEYHYCTPLGRSSKANIVATRYESEERFAGGSLGTANNAAGVCGKVDLLTVLGDQDDFRGFMTERLRPNVRPFFYVRPKSRTTVKRRFVEEERIQKVFEICYLDDADIPRAVENRVLRRLERTIGRYDLVIVADFGHGLLTPRIINLICKRARYLAVNVQTNSANRGFNLVTKYPRADLVCIDEMEIRYATQDRTGALRGLARRVASDLGCDMLTVTRGPRGSLSCTGEGAVHETPAFTEHVVDAIGAGDAFFAFVAPCRASGMDPVSVSFVGNAVGALAVQIVCNRKPVDAVELVKFITRLLK